MTDPINATGVDQADYLKLFMQELTYQDPLKPVDNREFMAQMAQFSALQEARTTNDLLTRLLGMNSSTQSLNLLGKKVVIENFVGEGTVVSVSFHSDEAPMLTVTMKNGEKHKADIGKVKEVKG